MKIPNQSPRLLVAKGGRSPLTTRMNSPNQAHPSFAFCFWNTFLPIATFSAIMACIYYFQVESTGLKPIIHRLVFDALWNPNRMNHHPNDLDEYFDDSVAITIERPSLKKRLIFAEELEFSTPPSPISTEEDSYKPQLKHVFPPPEQFFNGDSFLYYERAADRCMVANQWMKSLKCGILEASALGRVWVMDMRVCVPVNLTSPTSSFALFMKQKNKTEVYNDFRLYFNWKRFSTRVRVVKASDFEREIRNFNHRFPWRAIMPRMANPNVSTSELTKWKEKLIKREFSKSERPFWYQICANNSIIQSLQRPRGFLRFNEGLKNFAERIKAHMQQDYYALKVNEGISFRINKTATAAAENQTLFTSEIDLSLFVQKIVPSNTRIYVSSISTYPLLISSLKYNYDVYVLDDFNHFWNNGSFWEENVKENVGLKLSRIKFDSLMRFIVDDRVVALARKTISTHLNPSLVDQPDSI